MKMSHIFPIKGLFNKKLDTVEIKKFGIGASVVKLYISYRNLIVFNEKMHHID